MDRNQAIGFGLIAVLLLAYSFFFSGTSDEANKLAIEQTAKVEQVQTGPAAVAEDDSLAQVRRAAALGAFSAAATGEHLMRQGAVLVDDTDEGAEPRALFLLRHQVEDGRVNARGEANVISERLQFASVGPDGQVRNAGIAPHLNLRAATALLEEAGWTVQEGVQKNAAGEPFTFEILLVNGADDIISAASIAVSRRGWPLDTPSSSTVTLRLPPARPRSEVVHQSWS